MSDERTQADRIDRMTEALEHIALWSEAYPIDIFPEPSEEYYVKAERVLTKNGMSLSLLSAASMRHGEQSLLSQSRNSQSDFATH